MTEEKKDNCSSGSCCAGKKFLAGIVVGILIFVAGMMFAKSCPLGGGAKFCPMSGTQK